MYTLAPIFGLFLNGWGNGKFFNYPFIVHAESIPNYFYSLKSFSFSYSSWIPHSSIVSYAISCISGYLSNKPVNIYLYINLNYGTSLVWWSYLSGNFETQSPIAFKKASLTLGLLSFINMAR